MEEQFNGREEIECQEVGRRSRQQRLHGAAATRCGAVGGHRHQPLPRTEVTKRIWDYIRANNLQDPKDKRTIRADAKLRPVFGGRDSVTMFELTKHVNEHLKKG